MSKYKKLLEQYEQLDREYTSLKAQAMECNYQYHSLKAEYIRQQDQEQEIKELHESARRLKHDMKNHMLVLAAYLNDMEVEQAKNYVSSILDKLNQIYTYIETGNSILNYCINTKLIKANELHIPFKVNVENLAFHRIASIDLTAILSNLLDNAIEASKGVINPLIDIVICKKRAYETILVKNSIEQSILDINPNLQSTKNNNMEHGYGIAQVRELVEKYDGMIDIYEENKMFCVFIAVYP